LTGTKWWIGAAGQTATHTVALSKLIVDGKDCGIHWFIVPLRCPNTGRLLPGITAGDIGAKVARNGLDNGWIQFSSVRIPRQNMLMKWAQVSQDGVFTPPENPAISYNTLITERLLALNLMVECLAPAMIISIRYGVMRQQGPNNERIMDYQSHQWNLIPILASTFAMTVLFDKLRGDWNQALQAQHDKKQFLGIVQYWHGVSSGLKAWQGWWTMDALEIVRRSLGGHAYSSYSGMGTLITDFAVTTTGAGDNYTLSQQSAKWLLSIVMKQVKGGRKPYGYTAFLGDSKFYSPLKYSETSIQDSFRWLCTRVIESGVRKFTNVRSEKEFDKVWDANMMELIPASRLFSTIVMQETFSEFIKNAEKKASKPVVQVLEKLNQVLLLSHLLKESGLFLEYDYITGKDIRQAREKFSALCADLRSEAAALVDTFRYPDFVVNSVLGRSDGNLYQHYFDAVVNAPNSVGVPSYFEESIAPLTRSKL
jgi:acyl-CoA oxidase